MRRSLAVLLLAWLGQASPAAASFSGHARSVLYLYEADPPDSMEIRALGLQYLRADFRPALSNLSLHTYGSVRGDWSDEPFRHGRLYFGCIEWSSRASSRAGVGFCGSAYPLDSSDPDMLWSGAWSLSGRR